MRTLFLILLIFFLFFNKANGQKTITGDYYHAPRTKLKLKEDSTFMYTWGYHMSSGWCSGKWRANNDTIYLKVIPVYDTVKIELTMQSGTTESLVLSPDTVSEAISLQQNFNNLKSSRSQTINNCPGKLFYKKKKLFYISKKGKPTSYYFKGED